MVVIIPAMKWFFYMVVATITEDSTALNWRQLKNIKYSLLFTYNRLPFL